MSGVNKVIIIGHLGKDPETRYTPSGDPVCNVSIATSESWRDKATGEKKEVTEWHKVVFYRKLAEIAGQYLKKGSLAYVEGKLKTRKWTDKEGQDRYTTEIEANELTMLGGGSDGNRLPATPPADNHRPPQPAAGRPARPAFDDLGDDIPF